MSDAFDAALAVLTKLRAAGHVALFAGGCVRDRLLGLTPKDWDVATDAPPARVQALFPRSGLVGQAFGVVLVRQGRHPIEVATFRSDGAYADGRRPETVTFSTPEADARRRDFTINGLFWEPEKDEVIDYVGGRADLSAGVVRAIGEPGERFAEDHLRLLRAVRFAARLGFAIEPATLAAIRQHAGELAHIVPERVGDELARVLTPVESRRRAHALLVDTRLAPVLLRTVPPFEDGEVPAREGVMASLKGASFGAALAAWWWGLSLARLSFPPLPPGEGRGEGERRNAFANGSPSACSLTPALSRREREERLRVVRAFRDALRLSNDSCAELEACLTFGEVATVARAKRLLAAPHGDAVQRVLAALASAGAFVETHALVERVARETPAGQIAPPPLVTGDDLIAAGFRAGPRFKEVLARVYDEQLEGRVTDRASALTLARAFFV